MTALAVFVLAVAPQLAAADVASIQPVKGWC